MSNVIQFPARPGGSADDHKRMAGSRDRALAISVIIPRLVEALGDPDANGVRRASFAENTSFTLMPSGNFWVMVGGITEFSGDFVPKRGLINPAKYPNEGVTIRTWVRGSWQSRIFE